MKPTEVQQAYKKLGKNMSAISRLLQSGRSSVYRWKDKGADGTTAILLRLVLSEKVSVEDVANARK
jgi:transposase